MYMRQPITRQDDSPVPELGELLAAVCDNGIQHLYEVEADLMQTMFLLNEAIEKIGQHFTAIHQAVKEQQAGLDALLALPVLPVQLADSKQVGDFRDLREVIGDEVNSAVIGMQFHDLTSQLISRTVSRASGLRDLLLVFKAYGEGIGAALEPADIARLLAEMGESLKVRGVALDGGLCQSVQQRHMGCGEIELF